VAAHLAASEGGDVQNTRGLNSPSEVYFFSKKPEEYGLAGYYDYAISGSSEQTLDSAKAKTLSSAQFKMITFAEPTVDVQGKKYIYVVRSNASRDEFEKVMSPEPAYRVKVFVGIPGLHYSASETSGDAIGITVEAETPEAAKEQFGAWYAKIKEALMRVADRFAILNKELEQKIEELAAKRREELKRAKNAL
jgi:hypothetical protein